MGLLSGLLGRWAIIAAIGVSLFLAGFAKGCAYEQEKNAAFVAKVEAEGMAALLRAARKTKDAQETTKEVADAYAQNIVAIRGDYERRLHDARTRAGRVPTTPAPAPVPHRSAEPGSLSTVADYEAERHRLEIEIAELELRLATAATQIEAWKDYGRRLQAWIQSQ